MRNDKKKREMEINKTIEFILLALPKEIATRQNYLKAYKSVSDEKCKALFLALAEQEKEHEVNLKEILCDLRKGLDSLKKNRD